MSTVDDIFDGSAFHAVRAHQSCNETTPCSLLKLGYSALLNTPLCKQRHTYFWSVDNQATFERHTHVLDDADRRSTSISLQQCVCRSLI